MLCKGLFYEVCFENITNIKQTIDVTISYNIEIAPKSYHLNLFERVEKLKQDSISVLNQNANLL